MSRDGGEGDPADRARSLACIERGMRLSLAQCAQLRLTPDVVWDRDFGSSCASCVAMVQATDHREADDLPPIGGLALAEVGGVLADFASALGLRAVFVEGHLGV